MMRAFVELAQPRVQIAADRRETCARKQPHELKLQQKHADQELVVGATTICIFRARND